MTRLLLLVAIVGVIYLLFRSYRKRASVRDNSVAEDMVRCAHCGVHLPRGESVRRDGRDFCTEAHRDAYRE